MTNAEKIRALRRLAVSTTYPHEATAALSKAFELEAKYNVDPIDLEEPVPEPKPVVHAPRTWQRHYTYANGMSVTHMSGGRTRIVFRV